MAPISRSYVTPQQVAQVLFLKSRAVSIKEIHERTDIPVSQLHNILRRGHGWLPLDSEARAILKEMKDET